MPNPIINRRTSGMMGKVSGPSLLSGLVSNWELNEASGAAIDSTGTNNLTDSAADTTSKVGVVSMSRFFPASHVNQGLSHVNTASLQLGAGKSFSVSFWLYYEYAPDYTLLHDFLSKWDTSMGVGGEEYLVTANGSQQPQLTVRNLAGTQVTVTDTSSVLTRDVWYHVSAGYDNSLQQIWIQVNGNSRVSAACVGVQSGTAAFILGNQATQAGNPFQGRIDEAAFWSRSLSVSEVGQLYSNGGGNAYPFSAPQTVGTRWASAWSSQVVINGGAAPSANSVTALTAFINGLDSDGVLPSLSFLNIIAPDSLIAALTPVIPWVGTALWTNHNFVSGDLTINGLKGNGSTKYLDTGVPGTACTLQNTGVTLYEFTVPTGGTGGNDFGALSGSNDLFLFPDASGNTIFDAYTFSNGTGRNIKAASGLAGYYSGNRTSATSSSIYFANSTHPHALVNAIAASAGALPALNLFLFAANINGAASSFGDATISFVALHLGLSSAQSAAFFARIQTLRTALGGGAV